MKEVIDKLSNGIVEYDRPILELETEEIFLTLETNEEYQGSFLIRSASKLGLKAAFYSTNEKIRLVSPYFVGTEGRVEYIVSTDGIVGETEFVGDINIVSNAGEQAVRLNIKVENKSAVTTIGKIKNMFHFTNFVQTDYDEALKLFISPEFKDIFLKTDLKMRSIYEGLIENENKEIALEEFLIAENKKKPVNLYLSEYSREYDHPEETISDSFIVSKDNWGYIYVDIENTSDFLQLDKTRLTNDDFAGSNYELTYVLRVDKLHDGMNYGSIVLTKGVNKIEFKVTVDRSTKDLRDKLEYKRLRIQLYKNYIDFRTHRLNMTKWTETTLDCVERMRSIDDKPFFPKLIQAQLYISKNREADASWLLENVAEELIERRNEEIEAYCYYLYVRTLQKKETEFTEEMKKKIRGYYENGYDSWKILWILRYMDENYENNKSLMLTRIKEQYSNGMRSPIMYYESAAVLCEQPALLRLLNDFEVQVICFAVNNKIITEKLAQQFSDLVIAEKNITPLMLKALIGVYEIYKSKEILNAICTALIRKGLIGERYFRWYDEGVKNELKIAGIYENYLYSVSENYNEPLPQLVLMYFMYNTDVVNEKLAYLYANIISNKSRMQSTYVAYQKQMEMYAAASLQAGRMNKNLAVIYQDVMAKSFITPEIAQKLPDIIFTYMITCEDKSIKAVKVVHKELIETETSPVIAGKAYIHVYTEEPVILFEDIFGNFHYSGIEYNVYKLVDMEEYLKMCYEISAQDIGLCMHFADEFVRYRRNPEKSVGVLQLIIQMSEIRDSYKRIIEKEIIEFYMSNYDGDSLDDYLEIVDVSRLEPEFRFNVIELMILRNHYDRVYKLVSEYGYMNIEPRRLLKFATKEITNRDFEEDGLLVDIASYVFRKGKYNEIILEYLNKHYYGTTGEMVKIWEAGIDFAFESRELEERLIGQMLFTGAYNGSIGKVFAAYYELGAGTKVKKAYLISKSYDYFVKEKIVDDDVFLYLEKEFQRNEDYANICKMAYLRYYSEADLLAENQQEIAERLINELCAANIIFEFYKKYKKYFQLPYVVGEKTILEYRTRPESKVYLNYILETGSYEHRNYVVEEMRSVYPGVFVFEVVLFYGESLAYYVTEHSTDGDIITESENLVIRDKSIGESSSRYGILNDIMICQEMHEESTLVDLAKTYAVQKKLVEELFKLM